MWLNSQDCNREQCSCSVLPKKKRLVLYNFARCVHENNYSVLTKVSMHEAVEVVHGHLHRRSVSSNTVGRRFQATLNPLTQCNVFYLYLLTVFEAFLDKALVIQQRLVKKIIKYHLASG
uniref:Uncharacterized protein n=1 Tax=Zea mays TaxID=4577 RepID=C4J0S5_MAIZE|nr:unknown [Zea mays]ACR35660.1 unknown [Zea mays]